MLTRGSMGMYSPGVKSGIKIAAIDRMMMRAHTSLMSAADNVGSTVSNGNNVNVQRGYRSR